MHRMAVPLEYTSALGFHIYTPMSDKWGTSPLEPLLRNLSSASLQQLSGNGMHLVTQCSWMFYVLCNVVQRPVEAQAEPPQQALVKRRRSFKSAP